VQDKKRGQVDKMNSSQLNDEAESKLASLTKKAEDEVDKLASQNPQLNTGCFFFHSFLLFVCVYYYSLTGTMKNIWRDLK
jgi:hypothetical protein